MGGQPSPETLVSELCELRAILERHDLPEPVQQIDDKLRDLKDLDELLVFVVGEGNFGKSSLVNALLGCEVAKVSHLPLTWRIDVYRSANGQGEGAMLRRAGHDHGDSGPPWLSIEQAEADCSAQEREVKARRKSEGEGATFHGQVIEAQWYRSGLHMPPNLALVDTPGFAQARTGFNRATADVLANRNGMALRVEDVYELWYHRANCVLWAFKASKLEDADTRRVFDQLAGRGKPIVGVVTCVDLVPSDQRDALMARAHELYGAGVDRMLPVVCGGKSPEVGLGVEQLRGDVMSLAASGRDHKLAEAGQFHVWQAGQARDAIIATGDALIENIARLDVYASGTADVLLSCAADEFARFTTRFNQWAASWRATLPAVLRRTLAQIADDPARKGLGALFTSSEAQQRYDRMYHDAVVGHLGSSSIEQDFRISLDSVAAAVVAEGARHAAGSRLRAVAKSLGQPARIVESQATIHPPDASSVVIEFAELRPPSVAAGFGEFVERLFGGTGRVGEQAVSAAAQGVAQAARGYLADMRAGLSVYTKAVAERILDAADEATSAIYGGRDLRALHALAESVDKDIDRLSPWCNEPTTQQRRYVPLYRLYSPRDDRRLALVDNLTTWFSLNARAVCATVTAMWPEVAASSRDMLRSCLENWRYDRRQWDLSTMCTGYAPREGAPLQKCFPRWFGAVRQAKPSEATGRLVQLLAAAIPDNVNWRPGDLAERVRDFLVGLFPEHMSAVLLDTPAGWLPRPQSYRAGQMGRAAMIFTGVPALLTVLLQVSIALVWGRMLGGGAAYEIVESWMWGAMAIATVGGLAAAVTIELRQAASAWRLAVDSAHTLLLDLGQDAWRGVVRRLDADVFRSLVSRASLVDPRPLDLALAEGASSNSGRTALSSDRASSNRPSIIQYAMDNNAQQVTADLSSRDSSMDRDGNGMTALHWAAYNNNVVMAKILIKHGAEVSAMDINGHTPLHVAQVMGLERIAEYLTSVGGEP